MLGKAVILTTAMLTTVIASAKHEPVDLSDPEAVREIPELAWHALGGGGGGGPEDCVIQCWDQHEAELHIAKLVSENALNKRGGGSHMEPAAGLCEDKHPECGGANYATVESIQNAVDANDFEQLRSILEKPASKAYFAAERKAIQVLGCRGEVIAHVRLPMQFAQALAD